MSSGETGVRLGDLLERESAQIAALVRRRAGPALLRMEAVEDLVQGICAQALESQSSLDWRGEASFRRWLEILALQHLTARRRHWAALRRGGGQFLRRNGDGESTRGVLGALAASGSGPSTFAARRESVEIAAKAISLLPDADREWIASWLADEPLDAAARSRGQSYDAAQRARSRALERLKSVFELVRRKWS
jgi:hypothetical protein